MEFQNYETLPCLMDYTKWTENPSQQIIARIEYSPYYVIM